MKLRLPINLFVAVMAAVTPIYTNAATVTWTGGDASWDNGASWDSGTAPAAGDDAKITTTTKVTVTGDKTVTSLDVGANDTDISLIGAGSITATGAITFGGSGVGDNTITLGDGTNPLVINAQGSMTVRATANKKTTLVINSGVTLTAYRLDMGRGTNDGSTIVQNGGTTNFTSNQWGTNAPVRLGGWPGTRTRYELKGGEMNVLNANMYLVWDGGSVFEITGGVANIKGIVVRNESDVSDNTNRVCELQLKGGRLNIGSGGFQNNYILAGGDGLTELVNKREYKLGGGILGAYDNWSTSGKFELIGGETTIDTLNSAGTNSEHTITFSGIITGAGDIKKVNGGVLDLQGTNDFAGKLTVQGGEVVIGSGAKGSFDSGSIVNATKVTFNIDGATALAGNLSGVGNYIFNGSASNYTLSGTTSYTGTTTVGTGITLTLNNASTLLNTSSAITLGNGANIVLGQGTTASISSLSITGNTSTLDFSHLSGAKLTLTSPLVLGATGDYLIIDQYDYDGINTYLNYNNGLAPWQKLTDIKIQTSSGLKDAMINGLGMVTVFASQPDEGALVLNDAGGNEYTVDRKYFGSRAGDGVLVFTTDFGFAGGADPIYGFTLRDNIAAGVQANTFTVDSLLVNGSGNLTRGVSIQGQADSPNRWVALGNTGNSFTGDVIVQSGVLRAVIDVGTPDQNDITTLGVNNTIKLTTNGTVEFDSEKKFDGTSSGFTGDFTYKNNIQLGQNNVTVRQVSGNTILTGDITMIGVGDKLIENVGTPGSTLTLAGTITADSSSTALYLKSDPGTNISISPTTETGFVNGLITEGFVFIESGKLTSLGTVSITGAGSALALKGGKLGANADIVGDSGSFLVLGGDGELVAEKNMSVKADINSMMLMSGETFTFNSNGNTLTVDKPIENVFPGAIIKKDGEGTLVLKDAITGAGTLQVAAGKVELNGTGNTLGVVDLAPTGELAVNGDLALPTGLQLTGILSGTGSIDTTDITITSTGRYQGDMTGQTWMTQVESGGTFAGRLVTSGDVVFDQGSRFEGMVTLNTSQVPATEIQNPHIIATNGATVTLNGVMVSGDTTTPAAYWEQGTEYTFTLIQTDAGKLLGYDGDVLNDFNIEKSAILDPSSWGAFLTGTLGFVEGEQLTVTLDRNSRYVSDYALTDNQKAVSGGIDYALDNFKDLDLAGTELSNVVRYFNAMDANVATEAPAALEMLGGLSAYQTLAGQRADLLRHVEAVRERAQAGGKGINILRQDPANQIWVEATQSYQSNESSNEAPGYNVQTWGAALGVDFLSGPNYSVGAALAYSHITTDSDKYNAKSDGNALYVDLYGRYEKGPWSATFVLSGGTTYYDVKRDVDLGGSYHNIKAETDGKQILGMADLGYAIDLNDEGLKLEPHVAIAVGNSQLDAYTEEGFGNAGLEVSEQKMNILQGMLGVRLYKQYVDKYLQYETTRWELRAAIVEEMGDDEYSTTSNFIGIPQQSFCTKGDNVGSTGFLLGGSISNAFSENWSWFADVNAEFRNGSKGMSSTIGIRCTF